MTSVVYDPSENEVRVGGYSLTGVTDIQVNRGNDSFKNVDGIDAIYSARIKQFPRPYRDWETDRKSTRLNSSHRSLSRMPSSA